MALQFYAWKFPNNLLISVYVKTEFSQHLITRFGDVEKKIKCQYPYKALKNCQDIIENYPEDEVILSRANMKSNFDRVQRKKNN